MPTAVPEPTAQRSGRSTDAPRAVRSFALPRGMGRTSARIGALTTGQAALMVGAGLLLTGPARRMWPLTVEDRIEEGLEQARTPALTALSSVGSEAGNTLTVVALTLLACVGLVLIPRLPMWRQASFLALAVSLQALVFLVITTAVDRHRPDVDRLDASPPTSSYTSGHVGAATALYAGLAVVLLRRPGGAWRKAVGVLLLIVPLLVGVARLYRGMHHPTDVLGGLANGGLSLLIVGHALLVEKTVTAPPSTGVRGRDTDSPAGAPYVLGTTTVILNPTVTAEHEREALRRVLDRHGHHGAEFVETAADDPGAGQAARAVAGGARLIVVCGGDGTVRNVAATLAGSGIPLAIVPCGTGNLLARNLGLPLAPADALDAALRGRPHPVDLGRITGDDLAPTYFTAMAGAGLDAALMEHTDDRAKSVLGWPAYVLAGVGVLHTPRVRVTIRLDDGPLLRRSARMVLVGNVGTVQGGVTLLPAARPDDGVLDLLVLDPRGPAGWFRALNAVLRGGRKAARAKPVGRTVATTTTTAALNATSTNNGNQAPGPVESFVFRRAEVTFDAAQPRELDGDTVARGRRLTAEVAPGALTVMLPQREH